MPSPTTFRQEPSNDDAFGGADIGIELILYFAAVAEEMSFTRAARRLQIDQSWLSHKIRQLEATLRCNLFLRSTRRIELTPAGRSLLGPARRLADVAEATQAAARAVANDLQIALRIGALPHSFWNRERVQLIDGFVRDHPQIVVEVANGSSIRLLDLLRQDKLDVAFLCEPFDHTGLDLLDLRLDTSCLLIPAEHRLAGQPRIELTDLAGERIAGPNPSFSPPAYDHLYGPLIVAGAVAVPAPEFEQDVMFQMAFRRRLIAVCNVRSVEERMPADYVARHLADHRLTSRKWLARRVDYRTPAIEAFWTLAQRTATGGQDRRVQLSAVASAARQ
jgi:DNA-binding transcriptional LysR family regulator